MDNQRGLKAVPLGIFAAMALQLGLFVAAVALGEVRQPFSDMFDLWDRWLQYRQDGHALAYLFDPHNFHRLAWTRALVWLDLKELDGQGWSFVIAAGLCLMAAANILYRSVARNSPPGEWLVPAAIATMLTLSSVNALDVAYPIDTPYAEAFLFSIGALVMLDDQRWRWAAPLVAMAAAFGNAIALALWPVMIFSAWRGRLGWNYIATLVVVGAVFIALYAWGQTPPPVGDIPLLARLNYALTWLGLPWSTRLGGPLIGAVLLPVSLWLAATRGGWLTSSGIAPLGVRLILFSLGAAAMAALGRAGFEPETPMRYALFTTPLQIGLFFMAWPTLERRKWRPLIPLLFAALLAQQAYGTLKVLAVSTQIRAALADFAAGNDTPMVRVFVHPDPARARTILAKMRAVTGRDTTFAQ